MWAMVLVSPSYGTIIVPGHWLSRQLSSEVVKDTLEEVVGAEIDEPGFGVCERMFNGESLGRAVDRSKIFGQ